MTTTLSQAMEEKYSGQQFYIPEENVENLPNRKRILYEIEKVLEIEEKNMRLESVRKKQQNNRTILPNRDLYRIYKAVLNLRNVRPQIVYTGGSIMDMNKAERLIAESEKSISDLEPSL